MLDHQPLVWAEIAVTDMERAISFYQRHFNVSFKQQTMNDMQMAILESNSEENATIGLVKHEMMQPSLDGSTVYLHLTPTLSGKVSELEQAGVTILLPVMPINEGECGYIAIFIDSEGNKVGLWSKDL